MNVVHAAFSSIKLDRPNDVFRTPRRHRLSRTIDFEAKFDFRTLFYDMFWSDDLSEVICVGPPFRFTSPERVRLSFVALPSQEVCSYSFGDHRTTVTKFRSILRVKVPAGTQALRVTLNEQVDVVAIQPNMSFLFDSKDVLLTISKNNDLRWITNWIEYYTKIHAIRNFVFLDNSSTLYDLDELHHAMRRCGKIDNLVLLKADFPYGPLGAREVGGSYDSTFLQRAIYEAIRYRFLTKARMVGNFDIDELLVRRGDRSLWNCVEEIGRPVILLQRFDTVGFLPSGVKPAHFMFDCVIPKALPPKWIIRPQLLGRETQLQIHDCEPAERFSAPANWPFFIAHQLQVTTGWGNPARLALDSEHVASGVPNPDLRRHLDDAFPPDQRGQPEFWAPEASRNADFLCQVAAQRLAQGEVAAALRAADAALGLAPDHWSAIAQRREALRRLGRDEEAAALDQRLTDLRDNNPHFHALMARHHAARQSMTQARDWCERGLAQWPEDAELLQIQAEMAALAAPRPSTDALTGGG